MSIIRTNDRSTSYQVNGFKLRKSGKVGIWGPVPTYKGAGGGGTGTGSVVQGFPTDTAKGDFCIMIVESSGADATPSPTGWTHFSGSPVVDVADATGSKLSVLYRFLDADGPQTAVTIADVGDHINTKIYVFDGVSSFNVGKATATDTKTTASTSVTFPSLTTPSPNNLVVLIASRPDSNNSTSNFGTYVNANLTSITERNEYASVNGNGGGFVIVTGIMTTPGSTGTTTAVSVASTTNAYFVVALEPDNLLPA